MTSASGVVARTDAGAGAGATIGGSNPGAVIGTRSQNVEPSPGALLDADGAAEQLGQPLRQRQPEARAAHLGLQPVRHLAELVEEPRLVRLRDADAGVGHARMVTVPSPSSRARAPAPRPAR